MHLVKVSKNTYKNLVESSAGNYVYIPLDFLHVHPWTLGICIVQKN